MNHLVILEGPSGSGKSTAAIMLKNGGFRIYDNFWYPPDDHKTLCRIQSDITLRYPWDSSNESLQEYLIASRLYMLSDNLQLVHDRSLISWAYYNGHSVQKLFADYKYKYGKHFRAWVSEIRKWDNVSIVFLCPSEEEIYRRKFNRDTDYVSKVDIRRETKFFKEAAEVFYNLLSFETCVITGDDPIDALDRSFKFIYRKGVDFAITT